MKESGIRLLGATTPKLFKKRTWKRQLAARQESQWRDLSIELLNDIFAPLHFKDRIRLLYKYFDDSEVLMTSSFGTKSVFLLHLLSELHPQQKVHFIDTRYHFKETLEYKKQLTDLLDLKVIDILPEPMAHRLTSKEAWWKSNTEMCCTINKIEPLEPIKAEHKIWLSGLMSNQTNYRSGLKIFEKQGDIIKFHPILDIDEGEFLFHLDVHKLPRHPLEELGYGSIGCTHCTVKGEGRSGRWKGSEKTECGLHPDYFKKKE